MGGCEVRGVEGRGVGGAIGHWLGGTGVAINDAPGCVRGAEGGSPAGPNFRAVTARPNEDFLTLRTNGVEVTAHRRVFHPGHSELGTVTCPRCDQMVLLSDPTTGAVTDQWGPFSDALGTWYSGGSSLVQC